MASFVSFHIAYINTDISFSWMGFWKKNSKKKVVSSFIDDSIFVDGILTFVKIFLMPYSVFLHREKISMYHFFSVEFFALE